MFPKHGCGGNEAGSHDTELEQPFRGSADIYGVTKFGHLTPSAPHSSPSAIQSSGSEKLLRFPSSNRTNLMIRHDTTLPAERGAENANVTSAPTLLEDSHRFCSFALPAMVSCQLRRRPRRLDLHLVDSPPPPRCSWSVQYQPTDDMDSPGCTQASPPFCPNPFPEENSSHRERRAEL